ncbi:homoserine O-acetyltransferase [Niveomyces insectorum RCEF 264]|uniref:Homoserine O-acetyltransferase n=1 Tax=Niveomyces insectorum RCEF 264 TaxID=1081102 RepID=A0A167TAD7_9HYPO|nr:homoserine O-acetyltransferase [Niveomyces insectorum RCEF 264]
MNAAHTWAGHGVRIGARFPVPSLQSARGYHSWRRPAAVSSVLASRPVSGGRGSGRGSDGRQPRRTLHVSAARLIGNGGSNGGASNPAMSFPCLDAIESRSAKLQSAQMEQQKLQEKQRQQQPPQELPQQKHQRHKKQAQQNDRQQPRSAAGSGGLPLSSESGPEPSYTAGATLHHHCNAPLLLDWGGVLREYDIAYETWGTLNADKSNAILLHTGLSASSHAHSTELNPAPGWWERFIGPGAALDTDKYFVVCTNVLGGCYGSTGPSSIDPADGQHYATRFPILTLEDMVRAQFCLLDGLGIDRLYAAVGSSMGGMQSLAAAVLYPDRVGRVVSISGCARSHPYGIAMRHTQRQVLMMDPHWQRGFYYGRVPPHAGMKLAREIATVTYRSGPEWEQRFGRRRADASKPPALCPDFLIETYLDHAGEKFCLTYDPNSLLYVSKAMDLFDLGAHSQAAAAKRRREREVALRSMQAENVNPLSASLPSASSSADSESTAPRTGESSETAEASTVSSSSSLTSGHKGDGIGDRCNLTLDLVRGLAVLRNHPTLVMGVASDILFPAWQQYEVAAALKQAGNRNVTHVELSEQHSIFGHDTFLLDLENIGGNLRTFLGRILGAHQATGVCALPVDDTADPALVRATTPWTQHPVCVHDDHDHAVAVCVYTCAAWEGGRGVSVFTTPDAAADAAAVIQMAAAASLSSAASAAASHPARPPPSSSSSFGVPTPSTPSRRRRLSSSSSSSSSSPPSSQSAPAYRVQDRPGKGKGGVAVRHIRRGQVLLTERPVLLARLDVLNGTDPAHASAYESLLTTAKQQLPSAGRTCVDALAHSTGGPPAVDVLRTNGLSVSLGGVEHTGLYLEVAVRIDPGRRTWKRFETDVSFQRLNHACRPKYVFNLLQRSPPFIRLTSSTFWRFSPRTLVVEFVALRDIASGEEITHSYTQKDTTEETRAELLHHWGFHCGCAVCSSEAESAALDAKRQRLRAIQAEMEGGHEDGEDGDEGGNADSTPHGHGRSPLTDLATEMLALVDGDDALRAPRSAACYYRVLIAQAFWSAGDVAAAHNYTQQALTAAVAYGGPDDEHADQLRGILRQMGDHLDDSTM